ncbi:RGCVC family protein [Actinophytocola sp.]|jgi:hypothetical protein|uniref:RGCVC family protein n=1 Tax=Actinophytocola sp. TaxID=1872138 RepID=UPI002EDB8078
MPATDAHANVSGPQANGQVATGCAVCPHPWPDHDAIAARYCNATAAVNGQQGRGCVCTGK